MKRLLEGIKNLDLILKAFWYWILDNVWYSLTHTPNERFLLYFERYKICRKCAYRTVDFLFMKKTNGAPSSEAGCVLPFVECCGVCGCSLKLKLRLPEAECPLGKWSSKVQ